VFGLLLVEFLCRLTFGVATAMALTSSRQVTSGFFRVHLWVLLGVQTLAALVLFSVAPAAAQAASMISIKFWLSVVGAAIAYLGAVAWLYERPRLGKAAIAVIAFLALLCAARIATSDHRWAEMLELGDRITGGLLLGSLTTAMLLGHWYLNTPTMKLDPLKRLLGLVYVAVALRMCVCVPGAWLVMTTRLSAIGMSPTTFSLFLALRWLSGLIGVLGLAWLAWQTLRIPNTQSATGILYAAVILAFIGELTSQLLSGQALYPV